MIDPLSIAANVAGIVAFSGAVSKLFFQFFRSIRDAPSVVRDLASALYTLNIALAQVQGSLLNPEFAAVADDEQLDAIEACLASCKLVFESLNAELEKIGSAANGTALFEKLWASVKMYLSEEQILDYMRRVERERTTLLLVISNFSAILQANTMVQVQNLRVQLKNQGRRLRNIHVLVQSVANSASNNCQGRVQRKELDDEQTAAFNLASAYNADEIACLQSTDSLPSITLGASSDGSIRCVWEPPPESNVPLRQVEFKVANGLPPKNSEGAYQSQNQVVPLLHDGHVDTLAALGKFTFKDNSCIKALEAYFKLVAMATSLTTPFYGPAMAMTYEMLYKMLRKARELNSDIHNDLQYLEHSFTMIIKHWTSDMNDETLVSVVKRVQTAMTEYLQWVTIILDDNGQKRTPSNIRSIIKATPRTAKRERLMKVLTTAVEETKDIQNLLAQNKMFEMQRELLALQQRIHEQKMSDTKQIEGLPAENELSTGSAGS